MSNSDTIAEAMIKNLIEINKLKKISVPLDAPYLDDDDREDLLSKTKKIVPMVYISKNILDPGAILKEVPSIKGELGTNHFRDTVINNISTGFVRYLVKLKRRFEDNSGTKTRSLTRLQVENMINFVIEHLSDIQYRKNSEGTAS